MKSHFGRSYQWPPVTVVGLWRDWQGVLPKLLKDGNQEIIPIPLYGELSSPKEHGFFPTLFLWITFLFFISFNPWAVSLVTTFETLSNIQTQYSHSEKMMDTHTANMEIQLLS